MSPKRKQNQKPVFAFDTQEAKSIFLAFGLLCGGVVFLGLSFLHYRGHLQGASGAAWGCLILGVLMFLPGFYESRLAYYAWRRRPGYHFYSNSGK